MCLPAVHAAVLTQILGHDSNVSYIIRAECFLRHVWVAFKTLGGISHGRAFSRSKTQGIALSLGDKLILKQKG